MGPVKTDRESLADHLTAAGCSRETIEQYLRYCDSGDRQARERLLQKHRRALLEEMHKCQEKIECLDYLRYHERKKGA